MTTRVAVLGLGAMGLPMASWLSRSFDVIGADPFEERRALAADQGVTAVASAQEAARGATIALAAVRNGDQLEDLLHGPDGIVEILEPGAVVILTSTVGITTVAAVAARLRDRGIGLVDAPVSGGPVRAGEGDLLVTCGATPEDWQRALPVLEEMAGTLVLVGHEPGKGQAMKTVNQLLCGVHIAAAGEALALAGLLGLDQHKALEALMAGAAQSFMLGNRGPRAIEAYEGGTPETASRMDIFVKDMGIVTATAKSVGLSVPVAAAAEQLYVMGVAQGRAADDDSTIINVVSCR
ncbi:NAD(P)-dependent oxidoreductase [Schaalia sp. 19OD2882]|uniref:NAD(P)-dependent oxidoreductase n=1 Tax=Schaalia sp. 19OD2882 TaxID=2794089 RepID=UPI001C1F0857|nr:NAD(P)-dependent oxidoreductase [Schaalia sp. 19OD2882]QWW20087.1 NAD(P)-dependent oxidoreductase [Schaalia sp. 19OD2882]